MKKILCYGDSNTWGHIPGSGTPSERYARHVRWPGVMRDTLGVSYEVIEEGLSGRTTIWNDPNEEYMNGETYLIPCLQTHRPIDLVIIMLGTNDLKEQFSQSAFGIAAGVEKLVGIIQNSCAGLNGDAPKVLMICPAPVEDIMNFPGLAEAVEKSQQMKDHYIDVAERCGCTFLDAGMVTEVSKEDGIHLDEKGHEALGKKVSQVVEEIFSE